MTRPLGVRWHGHELPVFRAGALAIASVELENTGTTPWRGDRFTVSYHWLDDRRNAIVWDGLRTSVEADPGAVTSVDVAVRAPIPPGRYRLSIDVVDEGRFWFGEVGERTLDADVVVLPRIDGDSDTEVRLGDAEPAADWQERVLAAHREGFAVVGGSVEGRRRPSELAPYAPGSGRVPNFGHPLVCPSVVKGVEVEWTEVAGLPAAIPPNGEPSLYDGRITVLLPSGRRRG
jgi:hypothetical protein